MLPVLGASPKPRNEGKLQVAEPTDRNGIPGLEGAQTNLEVRSIE